jgi:hypothetical protein
VDGFTPHPAHAVNGRWDVLHENAAAASIFGSFASVPGQTDNVIARLFLDPAWRALFDQWETVATSAVAQFRAPASDARDSALLYTSVSIEAEPSDVRVIVCTAAGEPCDRISAH